jgi:hypothetical protein
MTSHLPTVGPDLRNNLTAMGRPSSTLWQQLAPHLQKQLAQRWARLIRQIQPSPQAEEEHDARD